MNKLVLIRRLLAGRPLQNLLAVFVMSCCVAMTICILLLSAGLHSSLISAGEPFPMLLGAKGSPNQLVLNSVFLKDQPVGNINYNQLEKLRQNKNIDMVIPLGFGDNYKGFRIVGTESTVFELPKHLGSKDKWLNIAQGQKFKDSGEAVIGAEVAKRTGLKVGDSFSSVHGVVVNANAEGHKEKYKVTGILHPVQGPYDSAVLVTMESIWSQHNHHSVAESSIAASKKKEVTAAVIYPKSYAASLQLFAFYSKDRDVQMIFPSKIIIQLFALMGDAEKLLRFFSFAVLALSMLIIGCTLYWFVLGSLHQQAVMRALGASVQQVTAIYFRLGITLVSCGLILGVLVGHGLYKLLSYLLQHNAGLHMPHMLLSTEAFIAAIILFFGAICSYIPAYLSGHRDITETL